jgi:dihydroxyacid dehydratase/phosphogluconate dehydratase
MGMTSTICFPRGNIAPEGSVIKSTAIDSSVVDADGLYRKIGQARVFTSEKEAVAAAKGQHPNPLKAGDIAVLIGCGPMGTGMEETYQLTSALRYLEYGKHVAVITDARFSGVSTGACIGHIGPEALAGGPIGKLKDGDTLRIVIDRKSLHAEVDFIGCDGKEFTAEEGAAVLAQRPTHLGLAADPRLPVDTQLWAALQRVSGGTWGGCVYDPERIIEVLEAGMKALK